MAYKRWTPEVVEKLREQARTKTINELSVLYDCSYSTINMVCIRQGIKPLSEKPRWSREVKSFILDNTQYTCKELSDITGHNQDSIRHLLNSVYGPRWRFPHEK